MNTVIDLPGVDLLGTWAASRTQRVRLYGRVIEAGLRFAFYGRVSTDDYQDPVSSRRWQFDLATELVAGRGRITAQFFDVGYSREIAWSDRPEAARLLAAITDPDRGFDAIVVGEYARAFYGSQATHLAPLLREHGVQLWLPEVDGPVDLNSPTHQALLLMLGAQSKLEVQRARFRTTAAMQAQAREQGRHLGGRATVRVSRCRRRTASQPRGRGVWSAPAPPGAGPGDRAVGEVDLRPAAGRHQRRPHRPDAQ